jgi:amino acid transporter
VAVNEQASPTPLSSDEETLHQLGYAQELRRRMSGFSNFAVSFTIISILSGCLTLYGFGMATGGPAVIIWGWLGVGLMTLFVGLAMAEVCSSFPTACTTGRPSWPRTTGRPGPGSPAGSTSWARWR